VTQKATLPSWSHASQHAQIRLDVGRPLIAPEHITFPQGP
jgi:hypothetical protein